MEAVAPLIRQLGALHAKQPSSIAEMSLKNELGDPAGLILQYLDTPETIAAIDMLQTTTADGGVPFAIVVTDKVAALLGLPPNHKRDFDAFITRTTLSDTAVGTSIPLGSDVRRFQLLRFGTVGGLQYMNPAHMALVLKAIRTVAASKHSTAARLDSRIQVSDHYDLIYAPDNLGSNTKSAIGICTYLFVEADLLDVEGRDPPFATFIKSFSVLAQIAATPDENGKYWYDHKKLITLKLAAAATVRALSAHHPLMRCEGFCPVCAIPHRNNRHQECPHVKTAVDAHRRQSNVRAGMGLSVRGAPAMTP